MLFYETFGNPCHLKTLVFLHGFLGSRQGNDQDFQDFYKRSKAADTRGNLEAINIDKINNINEYSKFVVYELHKYINTEFALIIQDDGFVISPESWRDDFLKYDYIGAPWGLPNDDFSFRDPFGKIIRVGNGGFSLRTKKLLSLPTKLNLEWKEYFGFYNEDGFFVCHNRHLFEQEGCVFADIDIARFFSHETDIPETKNILPFGFHGKHSKYMRVIY